MVVKLFIVKKKIDVNKIINSDLFIDSTWGQKIIIKYRNNLNYQYKFVEYNYVGIIIVITWLLL